MTAYDQIKKALQDIVAPELKAIQGDIKALHAAFEVEIKRLDQRIDSLRSQMGFFRNEMMSEFKRVDSRIDGVNSRVDGVNSRIDALASELRVAIEIRERLAALEAKVGSS